ncbi:helix-turn-helix transcriptional regulator [Phytohabitans rumicis]|uniref:Helix-turn-helix transcriptional regulator n=1 Tax=Phytohabitans rumicis TaxID=1076125 RepID=A0A6V8LFW5_9ACTN|nr:response regulator transcription factor [Phytohabitans rumicis]GFJ93758.1 helix-turn-helix transcriptional regulator [Phytohabitans rumicis]
MTTTLPQRSVDERPRACLTARNPRARAGLTALLDRAGAQIDPRPEKAPPPTVVVAAGRNVDEAVDTCPESYRQGDYPLMVVADEFSPTGVRRALQDGVRVMLLSTEVTPNRLRTALRSARHGDGRLPYQALIGLLNRSAPPVRPIEPLTARQSEVLSLIADGHGNAAIARALSCSEHTVKNVIYDLMARLQVNNRAQAVAEGIRTGLI